MIAGVEIPANQHRHIRGKAINRTHQAVKLCAAMGRIRVAFQMGGDHTKGPGLRRHYGGQRHAAANPGLFGVGRTAIGGKPMAVIIQTKQCHALKRHRRQDCIAVPALGVEIIPAKDALGWPAQTQFVKLDAKGVDHAQSLGHCRSCMALAGAGHAVIYLAEQHDGWGDRGQMGGCFFWEKAAFDIPGSNGERARQGGCVI
ncbi:hypothetical protein PH5382_03201 [Phaeobacter sp. CECT 5382]|nr:hypothetical protein PH5382_03201 [Phaeobacter sp. CECT 5382]